MKLYLTTLVTMVCFGAGITACRNTDDGVPDERSAVQFAHSLRTPEQRLDIAEVRSADSSLAYILATYHEKGRLARKIAITRNLEVLTPDEAHTRFVEAHTARFGRLGVLAAAHLQATAGEISRYIVWAQEGTTETDISAALAGTSWKDGAQHVKDLPIYVLTLRGEEAARLARSPAIKRVELDEMQPVRLATIAWEDTAAGYSDSYPYFNQLGGLYAASTKIGVLEPLSNTANPGRRCQVPQTHEAFGAITGVDLIGPPRGSTGSCSFDAECQDCAAGRCVAGQCVAAHAVEVMSRIASSGTTPGGDHFLAGAAKVTFVLSNNYVGTSGVADFIQAIEDMRAEGVRIINESTETSGLSAHFNEFDHVRDWYARYHDMIFVKASGNIEDVPTHQLVCEDQEHDAAVDCHSLNSICVGALSANSTRNSWGDDVAPCWSKFKNPRFANSAVRKQAERPDIVSEGEDAMVASVVSPTRWVTAHGTSFSAPVISGMVALMLEQCGGNVILPVHTLRAMLRQAATQRTSAEPASMPIYPIPGFSPDSHAGAGLPLAHALGWWCGGPPPPTDPDPGESDGTSGVLDPNSEKWFEPPSGIAASTAGETQPVSYGDWATVVGGLKGGANSRLLEVGRLGVVPAQSRIRATLAYLTCPGADVAIAGPEVAPSIDFDLALCDLSLSPPYCAGVSESNDDNTEGFDVVVDRDTLDLRLFAVMQKRTQPWPGCNGDASGEPYTAAYSLWKP